MNHDVIAAHDVIARYVADRLGADEERDFEAHLVDCAQCSDGVEQELALREGLSAASTDRTTAPRPAAPARERTSGFWLQAAAAALVVAGVGLAFSLARTTSALNVALSERGEQQRRADEATRTAQGLERRVADLEAASKTSPGRNGVGRSSTDPLLPTTVFALTAVRGGDAGAVDTFTLDRGQIAPLVVLTVDIPPGEYAVTLNDRTGREVWSGGRFRPSSQDVMAIAVDRSVLSDGQYTLEVHRRDAAGQTALAARYRFQISSR